jgi:catechol 2,3-dioxygenase-like lactoylglutathione lyase family enzyme
MPGEKGSSKSRRAPSTTGASQIPAPGLPNSADGLGYPTSSPPHAVPLTVSGIGHIVIPVNDMQRALGFYRDALGFTVVGKESPGWTVVDGKGAALTLWLQVDAPRIALGEDLEESPFFFHVANFAESANELERRGFRVKRLDGNQGIVWDPSGNVLGLHDHRTEGGPRRVD